MKSDRKSLFTLRAKLTQTQRRIRNNNNRNFGFTLPEVLITLGIIGVVAAVTISNLVAKSQMKMYEVAFKKEYSTIQSAIDYITMTDELSQCYMYHDKGYQIVDADCEALYSSLVQKLNLNKINKVSNLYAKKNDVLSNGGSSINNNVSYDYFLSYHITPYSMKNGSIVMLPYPISSRDYSESIIVLDINGKKGPNKWGYDVFWMNLTQHKSGKILLTDEYASLKEKGGRYPREILRNVKNSNDNKLKW